MLPHAIERFSIAIAGEYGLSVSLAFDEAFESIDRLADGNLAAVTFMATAERLAGRCDLPVSTRLEAIDALRHGLDWGR